MGADLYRVDGGYFRDSYNNYSILNRVGLSWWEDIIPLCSEDGILYPEQARVFLNMLHKHRSKKKLRWEQILQYEELYRFLVEAIDKNYSIDCSL